VTTKILKKWKFGEMPKIWPSKSTGISFEQLSTDSIKLRAFERIMELVGESIKRVPQDFRDAHPEIPWRKIAGMRDVISHAYEDLAYEVLWDAVEMNFPVVLSDLKRILADF
jgi:uncharacterized protein with HEPN domain